MIYEYAFLRDNQQCLDHRAQPADSTTQVLVLDDGNETPPWQYHFHNTNSTPTWLALMQSNRQLRREVSGYLNHIASRKGGIPAATAAKAHIHLAYPSCTTTIKPPSLPPQTLHTLDVNISLSNLFHGATLPPSHTIATAIWTVIRRYTSHGPHLARERGPLQRRLPPLEKVRITLAEEPLQRDLVFLRGNPWMQILSHYGCLKSGLVALATAAEGEDGGDGIGVIETRFGRKGWEEVFVGKAMKLRG